LHRTSTEKCGYRNGSERVLTVFNGKKNVYDTELFIPVMTRLDCILGELNVIMPLRDKRIICDHIRGASFKGGYT
jgi:alanyl-tRNA synthetase